MNTDTSDSMDIHKHYLSFAHHDLLQLPESATRKLHTTLRYMGKRGFAVWCHTHFAEVYAYTQGSDKHKQTRQYQIDRGLYAYAGWQLLCRADCYRRAMRESHIPDSSIGLSELALLGVDLERLLQDLKDIPPWHLPQSYGNPFDMPLFV